MGTIRELLTPQSKFNVSNKYLEIGDIDVTTHDYTIDKDKPIVKGAVKARKGTILISTVRPTRGAIVILRESIYVSSALCQVYIEDDSLRRYIYQYFLLPSFSKYMADNCEGGTYPTIKDETIYNHKIELPFKEVIDFNSKLLKNFDDFILSKKNEISILENYKSTMLYKMFPKEGESVPEIRFKGFSGDWKKEVFGKLFVKLNNNSMSRDLLNYNSGDYKNIHYGDILIRYGFSIDVKNKIVPFVNEDVKVNEKKEDILKTGDVVFADTAEDTTAGKMVEIDNDEGNKVLAGLHTYPCRPLIKFEKGYLGVALNTYHFHNQLVPYMQGTKVTGFNYDYLCRIYVRYPNLDEQKEITNFFINLDTMIENQEKEIKTLEHFKATVLSKMFA